MKKIYFLFTIICFAVVANAQVTGTKTIGVDYPTLAAAITDLNTVGVGVGGATINVPAGYTETAPSGGYVLGSTLLNATLIVANPLVIQKSGAGANPLFTAFTGGTSITSDGVIKLAGTDYITIDGLNVVENAANSGAAFMEWGIALVNLNGAAPFDGCQNVTIKNCSVTLDRTNPNGAMGIYSAHNIATSNAALIITTVADLHSNNKFYSNTITNVNEGIWLLGYAATTPYTLFDQNNDIGGNSAATGNTVRTMGVTALFNTFCIYSNYQNGINISYNTIDNGFGGAINTTQLMGIFTSGATASVTVLNNNVTLTNSGGTSITGAIYTATTGSLTANNNTVALNTSAGSGTHYGIYSASIATTNILNNSLTANNSGAVTGALYFIYNAGAATTANINNNTIGNANLSTTGTTAGIYNSATLATLNVNSNTISNISRTAVSGTHYGVYTGSPTNGTFDLNTIDGISFTTITSTGTIYGIYDISSGVNMTYTNNVVRNFSTPTTGSLYGIREFGTTGIKTIQNNQIYNFSTTSGGVGGTSMWGLYLSTGSTNDISNNKVYALNSTGTTGGTGGTIIGFLASSGTTNNIYKNKIYDLSTNSTGAVVYGLQISGGTTNNLYNNIVGDIRAPFLNAAISLAGFYLSGGTTINAYYNTVRLNAVSAGALFGSSAIYASTTPALTLRNNIFVNNSTSNGATGFSTAYRRSSATLTTYGATSNNNLFFAGATCANNLIFYDGTNSDQTLAAFKTRVTPRDAASITEDPAFASTTGSSANFLHINTTTPTQIESGGAAIVGYLDDFDGDVRNAATPDIGADEFTGVVAVVCSGTPVAGTITATPASVCAGQSSTLCVSGQTAAAGISIKWQSSPVSGGPYTDIPCAGGTCYNTGALTAGTYYYVAVVTCSASGLSATTPQVTLVVNALPTAAITPAAPAAVCQGTPVNLTASGGVTYSWSPAAGLNTTTGANVIATPATTTTYTVTVTNAANCSSTATVTINVNPGPVLSSTTATPTSVCLGGTSQLLVSLPPVPPYCTPTYSSGSGSGDYITNVTLGAINNTTGASAAPYYTYYSALNANLTAGSPYTITGTINNGGTEYIAAWIDYNQNGVFEASEKIGEQAGLSFSLPFTVPAGALNGITRLRVMNVYNTTGLLPCNAYTFGETEDYNVTISGGASANLAYSWAPAATLSSSTIANPVATPITTTTYVVTVTGGNGCTSTGTATVTVNNPDVIATPATQSICSGNSITPIVLTSSTGGTTFTWTRNNPAVTGSIGNSGSGTPISGTLINATTSPITVTFTITPTNGACTGTGTYTATVVVNPTPNATITYSGSPYCSNAGTATVTRTGTVGGTYSSTAGLSINAATGDITLGTSTAGTYTVTYTVAASGGCALFTTTTSVTVKASPIIGSTQVEPTTCASADGSITLTITGAAGPYTFTWTGSGVTPGSQNQTGLTVGAYAVTVTAGNGCSATANFALSGPGGCSICPTIGSLVSNPSGSSCSGNPITLTASGLVNMGSTYGIIFKQSASALANPYTGGTVIATILNGGLTSGGTVATTTATLPAGTYFIYAILTPTPVDPVCRPSVLVNHTVNPTPDVNQPANQAVCNNTSTAAVNFTGSVPGTTFNWANNTPSIGLGASGTGNIASFTATNVTTSPVVATITVTPVTSAVDQSQTSSTTCMATFNQTNLAQSFIPTASTLCGARIYIESGVGTGDITIQLYTNLPNAAGVLLAQGTATGVSAAQWASVSWASVAVTPGTTYYLVFTSTNGVLCVGGNTANPYANGQVYANAGYQPFPTFDYTFETFSCGTGCTGTPKTFTITVNPTPSATIAYTGTPYCSNAGTATVTQTGTTGGTYTATPAGLTLNATTGAVTLATSTAGTYTVTYTIAAAGGCPQFTTTATITITTAPSATIAYTGSPYCSNGGTANVTRTGTAGGTYSSTAGLTLNATTGAVTLGTSTPGTYTVTYTLAGGGGCATYTTTATITITAAPNMIILYAGTPYCSNAGIATVSQFGTPGGTYSASPAGLSINATTGAVTLATSTPGTYTVTYSVVAAGCGTTITTTTITVTAAPNATIAYTGSPYCSNGGTANVTRTGTAGGTYSSTIGLTLNATTGAVTLGTSTPGTYTVTYTIAAGGGCGGFTTTTTITITALPTATISYAGNPFCQNAGVVAVTRTGTAGGTYTATPAGLTINASTGAITTTSSTAGTYTVSYTIAAGGGCAAVVATTSVTITTLPAATIAYAGSPYCQNAVPGTATVTRTGTAGGTYTASPAGLTISATTGTVTLGTSTPGTYTVTYTIAAAGGCGAVTATATIVVSSLSTAPTGATATATTVCGPTAVTLTVAGGSLGTGASWKWYTGSCGGTLVGTGSSITITPTATTTYYVRAEGTCNTTTCGSIVITVNVQPTVTIAASSTSITPLQTATLTATVTPSGTPIQWYRNGTAVPGATSTTLIVTVDQLGSYTARVTTGTGCTALSNAVTITGTSQNNLFVYPNPNNGQFIVRYYAGAQQFGFNRHVAIFSESGQKVYDKAFTITAPYSSMNVDIRNVSKGFYTIMVTDAFGKEILATAKVVVQ